MPTRTVQLIPGVNTEKTPSLNEAAYQSTQLIRWEQSTGLPQKIGGWAKFYPNAIGSIVRALHAWEDLSAILHIAVGAEDQLSVITGGQLMDITPQTQTDNIAPSFSTTMGSQAVIVSDPGSDATVFDILVLETQVSVGGIVLSGAYAIDLVLGPDTYQITAASPATATVANGGAVPVFTTTAMESSVSVVLDDHGLSSGSTFAVAVSTVVGGLTLFDFYTVNSVIDDNTFTINAANLAPSTATAAMNGGLAQLLYQIAGGPPQLSTGYGIGGYGLGGYGTGVVPPVRTGTPITTTSWSLDNYGAILMANPIDGPIYMWAPNSGLQNGQMIPTAPLASAGIFVAMPAEILVAYGAETLGIQDPLLLRWSDAGDFTDWIASVTNQAGQFRISRGSKIVGAGQGPQYGLIWTDLDLWAMSYIGPQLVFSFNELATGCGLIAQFGWVILGTTAFWMSQKNFFALPAGGSVIPVPCAVWDFVFQNLNPGVNEDGIPFAANIRAAANSQFGEVTWYFPSNASANGENDSYVKFTPNISAWDFGMLPRSAWIDQSVFGSPIGSDPNTQFIYQHEISNDGDGAAIEASFTTGYWALSDGGEMTFVDLVMPDMKFGFFGAAQAASVQISFTYANYAQATVYTRGPFTMQSGAPNFINSRFRGRLAAMTIKSSDVGTWWRLGGLRIRTAPDGRL